MPAAGPPAPERAPAAPASVAIADASHEPDEATEPGEPDEAPPEPLPPDPEPRLAQSPPSRVTRARSTGTPAPLARTLVIVDAARRRVRPPIPITPDDMAFEVAAVWTGRAVLVASGFLREIVVQRLGCAP